MDSIKLNVTLVVGSGTRDFPDLWAVDIYMPITNYSHRVKLSKKSGQELDCYADGYIDLGVCDDEQLDVLHQLGKNNYGRSTAKKLFNSVDKQQTLVKRYIKRLLDDGIISKEESVELANAGFDALPLDDHVKLMLNEA